VTIQLERSQNEIAKAEICDTNVLVSCPHGILYSLCLNAALYLKIKAVLSVLLIMLVRMAYCWEIFQGLELHQDSIALKQR